MSNWPPRHWLEHSVRHNRFHGYHNLGLATFSLSVAIVTGAWWPLFAVLAFGAAGVDHLRDARRAQRKLEERT